MTIPKPFAIAIDDLGWIKGNNEGYLKEGPYRVGLKREMGLADYLPIVNLAKRAGVRLQGLFILGELDRENIVRSQPTMVPPNKAWYQQKNELQVEIMDYVKAQSSFLEFGLHGIGHEYWPDAQSNKFKRAEWYNLEDKKPWSEQSLRIHLDCFSDIMAQYGLSKANNHSFPESFVPCAYSYYWNPKPQKGSYSLGALLYEYGVRYANTDFSKIPECNPPIDGGFDQGVHVINRYNFGNLWYMIGQLPIIPLDFHTTPFIETHWPNLLAQDDFLQEEITTTWVNYFASVKQSSIHLCSKNTAEHHSQFLYHKYCRLSHEGNTIKIDATELPEDTSLQAVAQNLVLKIPIKSGEHLQHIRLDNQSIPAYYEAANFAYLYLPKLSSDTHILTYQVSNTLPNNVVWHDSTSNIYSVEQQELNQLEICGRFYGQQTISFLTNKSIESIHSDNPLLAISSWKKEGSFLKIYVNAHDIQGVTANLILHF